MTTTLQLDGGVDILNISITSANRSLQSLPIRLRPCPVNGEQLAITVHFDHDCKERKPGHSICFPQVGACSREITFPVAHMSDVKEFEHIFLFPLCKGSAFSKA